MARALAFKSPKSQAKGKWLGGIRQRRDDPGKVTRSSRDEPREKLLGQSPVKSLGNDSEGGVAMPRCLMRRGMALELGFGRWRTGHYSDTIPSVQSQGPSRTLI